MGTISEANNVPYLVKPGDHQAGVDCDSVFMGRIFELEIMVQFGSLTNDAVLTLNSGATDGVKTTAETFRYRLADATQGSDNADQFGDWASSSSLTLTAATYQNKLLILSISAAALTDGQPWLTLSFSSAASALNASVVLMGRPRYASSNPKTVLA